MLTFLIRHIRSHPLRSLSLCFLSCVCSIAIVLLTYLYANSTKALSYYSYNIIDGRRVTLSTDTNYFDMFSRSASGLPQTLQGELERDPLVTRVQAFSLVELPVLARFSLFEFALETDIPIFSVTDSSLTGSAVPIGISRAMIDFYNMRVAGTAKMFPQIPELLIRGQAVRLTFGASKIFPASSQIATPIDGQIMSIDENYPGFGLTLPESIVRAKMAEIGHTLAPPYKIVILMRDISDRDEISRRYQNYRLQFDADAIETLRSQQDIIGIIFLGVALFFSSILFIFFILLIFSFFRERRDIFRVIYIFGLSGIRARMLTLAEPIFLILCGSMISVVLGYLSVAWLTSTGTRILGDHGILFPLMILPLTTVASVCLTIAIVFVSIVVILELIWRRKSLMR